MRTGVSLFALFLVCVEGYEGWKSSLLRTPTKSPAWKSYVSAELKRPHIIRSPSSFIPVLNTPPPRPPKTGRSHRELHVRANTGLRSPKTPSFTPNLDRLKAEEHFIDMEDRASCSLPRERVVCVQDYYPDAEIQYRPACTILHRCDASSGCCHDSKKTCGPLTTGKATLLFKTSDSIGSPVVKLTFTNHTSCKCTLKEDSPDTLDDTKPPPRGPTLKLNEVEDDIDEDDEDDDPTSVLERCPRCPKPFSKRLMRGICSCDCFDSDRSCMQIKEGRDTLEDEERRCVYRQVCNKPQCSRGYFDVEFGMCKDPRYEKILEEDKAIGDEEEAGEEEKLEDEIEASLRAKHRRRHRNRKEMTKE